MAHSRVIKGKDITGLERDWELNKDVKGKIMMEWIHISVQAETELGYWI